jgi:hypothetical protein
MWKGTQQSGITYHSLWESTNQSGADINLLYKPFLNELLWRMECLEQFSTFLISQIFK